MAPLLRLHWALALAVASGSVMWLAFAPVAVGALAIPSVAMLTLATWRSGVRRGLLVGLVGGLAFFLPLLSWMRVIGADAWILVAVFCALWVAGVGGATALVTRLPLAPVWVGSLWVLEEALRGRIPLGGFPWGELAFAQPDTLFVRYAGLGGTALVTFVVATIGAALVSAVLELRARRIRLAVGWVIGCAALVISAALIPIPNSGDDVGGPPSAVVAIVQGGTPQYGMGALDVRRAVLDNHVKQTLDLAAAITSGRVRQPDFVVWPENSSDLDPFADPSAAAQISAAARAVGAPILVGAVVSAGTDPPGLWNVGIVWDPERGPQQMYVKNHPVPFGEYIPFRDFLTAHIGRLERIPVDFLAGDRPGNLTIGGVPIGDVICFEVAYDEIVDQVVDGGARLLTVQTNNATYGGTDQPAQQFAIERVRATEYGRTVAVAATSGISAFISPDGTVTQELTEGESGWLVQQVDLRGQRTVSARIGAALELLLSVVGAAAIAAAIVHDRRTRGRRESLV